MGKAANETQATLRLLGYALSVALIILIVVRLLSTYVIGNQSILSVTMVSATSLYWIWKRYQQTKWRSEQETLLAQHQSFAAEVERAWERSHTHDVERRRGATRSQPRGPNPDVEVPDRNGKSQQLEVEASTKKKKKKKKEDQEEEEIFFVDDDVEAKVVEDLEDFLQHSSLRQALKNTANGMRESQQRRQEKAPKPLLPQKVKVPEQKLTGGDIAQASNSKPEKATAKAKAKAEKGNAKAENGKASRSKVPSELEANNSKSGQEGSTNGDARNTRHEAKSSGSKTKSGKETDSRGNGKPKPSQASKASGASSGVKGTWNPHGYHDFTGLVA